jgi:uncharacterized integral membrane protein (TIGR00698 family)
VHVTQAGISLRIPHPDRGAAVTAVALGVTTLTAEGLGAIVPAIGAPAFALLVGMAVRLRFTPQGRGAALLAFGSRTVLQSAIVVLGLTFGLSRVAQAGRSSLPVMLGTLAAALVAAWLFGRALRVESNLQTLVGVGTAICGASAIGAVSGVIGAAEGEIAYAISTIFVFNVVAVVLYPPLGHLLSLGQHAFGLWAGTAINDTSSVVAAASAYGHTAAGVAVVTKLVRTTMIIPIVIALAFARARRAGSARSLRRAFPTFLIWFLVASGLNSAGLIGPSLSAGSARAAAVLITIALGAIGLSVRLGDLRRAGPRPLLLGAALWAVVGVTGLLLQGSL